MKKLDKTEVLRAFALPNKLNLGIRDDGDWSLHDITKENHSLFIGGMGSGFVKSLVMTAYSFLLSNPNGLLVVTDPFGLYKDFEVLKSKRNLMYPHTLKNSTLDGIDFVFNEMLTRKKIVRHYKKDEFTGIQNKTSPILFVIDLDSISPILKWDNLNNVDGTPANKLKMILKEGSSFGITVVIFGRYYSESLCPHSLIKYIQHTRIFKLNLNESELFKLEHLLNTTSNYQELSGTTQGRSCDNKNLYQFLALSDDFIQNNPIRDEELILLTKMPTEFKQESRGTFFDGKNNKDFCF